MTIDHSTDSGGMDRFFEKIFYIANEIESSLELDTYFIRIANHICRLMFTDRHMAQVILPALEHLLVPNASHYDLTITLWDGLSQKVQMPDLPWKVEHHNESNPPDSLDGGMVFYKDGSRAMAYKPSRNQLSLVDLSSRRAVFWIPQISHLYPLDGRPLRTIFQWLMEPEDYQIVHAGGVGFAHGGVLLTGRSGAGKSTSTAACLDSDLLLAGDENVLLSSSGPIRVYSLYNSMNLDEKSVSLVPVLNNENLRPHEERIDKVLYYLHRFFPQKIISGFPLKAVVVSQVIGKGESHVMPISQSAALLALAPTSLFQEAVNKREAFSRLSRIIKQVPCFQLSIGQSLDSIPSLLIDLIESASRIKQ